MTANAADALRYARTGQTLYGPVKAGVTIFQAAMIMLVAGQLAPARAATTRAELDTIRVVGLATSGVVGGASDGDEHVTAEVGCFRLANSAAGEALSLADVGKLCFAADDATVAKTSGGGMRPIAGKVVDVDAEGVWVDFAFAREPRRVTIPFAINETDTLAGTSAELVSPVAGAISALSVTVQKAVTTGGDVTVNVAATPVAGLACTVADAAAKGTIVNDTPTAGDATTVVAVGSRIQVVPAAAFNTAGAVSGYVEITY